MNVGEDIKVKVINIEKETLRIALSKKRLEPEPWETLGTKISLGDVYKGRITKITNFGAFARIEGGLEGLVHISEISESDIDDPSQVLSEGEELDLKIIRIDHEKRRLALSVLLDKDHFSKSSKEESEKEKVDEEEKVDEVENSEEENVDEVENSEDSKKSE